MIRYSLPTINWVLLPGSDGSTADDVPRPTKNVQTIADAAAAAGFGSVGIDGFTAADCLSGRRHPSEVRTELDDAGLSCSEVGVLAVGLTDGTQAAGALARLAAATGAGLCITVIDAEPGPQVAAKLAACADILTAHGIRMALEFLPYGPLATLRDAARMCDLVGWERCGILLDSWHFFHSGAPWTDLKSLAGEQIPLVQVNDAPPPIGTDLAYESRFRRVLPGEGTFSFDEFARVVMESGFDGVISPEILSLDVLRSPVRHGATAMMAALSRHWPT